MAVRELSACSPNATHRDRAVSRADAGHDWHPLSSVPTRGDARQPGGLKGPPGSTPGSLARGAFLREHRQTVHEPAFAPLQLRHFSRCLAPLWRAKDRIERALYERGLDLFNQTLDLVFFDTTSTYCEGTSLDGWAKRGKSKDHRPDHLQLVIGVVIRQNGMPITCEIWPGTPPT